MSRTRVDPRRPSARFLAGAAVAAGLALLAVANYRFVTAAISSEPDCVLHAPPGQGGPPGSFSAAKSSCRPTLPPRGSRSPE